MSLSFDIQHTLPGFDLDVSVTAPDGVTALVGRSGAGKTTVANAVAGLLRPEHAKISVGASVWADTDHGICRPPAARRVGYVFQEARLFPHLSVMDNVLYGARRRQRLVQARDDLPAVVAMLGVEDLLSRRPMGLSGGEKQRVAIARALLSGPELLILDEPLAALDPARKAEVLPYIERLRDHARIPILYISHAMEEVARLAQTVVVLDAGRVHRSGPVAEVLADPLAVPHAEAGAVLEAVVAGHDADGLTRLTIGSETVFLPHIDAKPGARVRLRVAASEVMLSLDRPERVSALNILKGRVEALHHGSGPGALVTVTVGQNRLVARITQRSVAALELAPGVEVFAVVKSLAVAARNVGT